MKLIIKIIPVFILVLLLILPVIVRNKFPEDINLKGRVFKVATGADGGIYKPLGQGLVTLLNEEIKTCRFEAVTTGGSVDNLKLLSRNPEIAGENMQFADIALVEGDIALSAFKGEVGLPESSNVRGILALYREFLQVYVRYDSQIKSFEEIGDKIVAIGDYGSAMSFNAKIFCEAAKMDFEKIDKRYMPFRIALQQLKNKNVDVVLFFGGGKLEDIERFGRNTKPGYENQGFLKLLPLSEKTIDNLKKSNYEYLPITITSEDYSFLSDNIETVGHAAILASKESVPDALISNIYKIILESVDKLAMFHPVANEIKQIDQSIMPLPLHTGVLTFSGERFESFTLTFIISFAVLIFAFFVTMKIVHPGSFGRFFSGLLKSSQGKGYITLFSVIFLFMCIILLVGSAFLSQSEKGAFETQYTSYQSSLEGVVKTIITGFDARYLPSSFYGQAIVHLIFVSYLILLILLIINIIALILVPYQQCSPAQITQKLIEKIAKPKNISIAQTKDFSKE